MNEPDNHPTKLLEPYLDQVMPWVEWGFGLVIVGLLGLVIGVTTIELAWVVLRDLLSPPLLLLSVGELQEVFGHLLLLGIAVRLLVGVRAYARERVLRAGVVLEVALLAAVRQLVLVDLALHDGVAMLGIAALVIASAGGLYLERAWKARAREQAARAPTPAAEVEAARPALPLAVDDAPDLHDPTDPPRRSRVATLGL